MSDRRFSLVLGMHRSGTSVLTAALQLLGAELGAALVPPAADNPGGYFENAAAVAINEALLLALGGGWDCPEPLPEGWLRSDAAETARAGIRRLLAAEFAEAGWHALKDPRLCRLLPLWLPELEAAGASVDVVLATRAPGAIVASLVKRDRMWPEDARRLAVLHLIEAEHGSRGCRRAVLDYDTWLLQPEAELQRLADALGWPVDAAACARAAKVLDATQQHHPADAATPAAGGMDAALAVAAEALRAPDSPEARQAMDALRLDLGRPGPETERERGLRWSVRRERLRLQEMAEAHGTLQGAFRTVERTALQRLDELAALDLQLRDTQAALERAEGLSLVRLRDFEAAVREGDVLRHRIGETQAALERAEALSLARLADYRVALERAEALSLAHLADYQAAARECEALRHRIGETRAALDVATAEARQWASAHAGLRGELDGVLASRSWRWTAPLRWLSARLGRGSR